MKVSWREPPHDYWCPVCETWVPVEEVEASPPGKRGMAHKVGIGDMTPEDAAVLNRPRICGPLLRKA